MINIPVDLYCHDCRSFLPVNQFARRKRSRNSFQPRCLSCASRRIRKWKSRKRKEILAQNGQMFLFDF